MLTIDQYVRAESLEQAYALCQKKSNVVLGGMLWLKLQHRRVGTAIDLCGLGLDQIEDAGDEYRIGAMVSLRALETHAGLAALTGGAVADAVRPIVGVQFRNGATVGGSLFGRFGFSDVLTLFLVLGARVELYHAGVMELAAFAALPRGTRDILVRVLLPKTPVRAVYLSQRNTKTDLPVLTCALARRNGAYTCAVGARPMAAVAVGDENGRLADGITEDGARAFAADVAAHLTFGGNLRAGAAYRRRLCEVLVRRAALAMREA